SILDVELVRQVLREQDVRGIIHIAAKKQVGESVADPVKYYRENVVATIGLLHAAIDAGVDSFVFSSSAATYRMPDLAVGTEDAHVAALEDLVAGRSESSYRVFNIGRGEGSSVREVLDTVAKVTGTDLEPVVVERRPGDPARIVASADRIKRELGWSARHDL